MNQVNQELCELAEVIYEKPLSGVFDELLFGSDKGNTLWVKFSDKDGINEWIGKFEIRGARSPNVSKYEEPDKFLISECDLVYLVDATNRKLIGHFKNERIRESVFDIKRKRIIGADYTHLHGIDLSGKIMFSKQIAVDWISELKIENNTLTGLACRDYGGEEQRFLFDLDTLKILRWEKIPTTKSNCKKPWWKFW